MAINLRSRGAALGIIVVGLSLAIAGCSGTSTTAPSTSAAAGDPFGTPNAAKGDPVVFGALNLESGPVTFPEALLAEQAAISYVNAYKGGIGGHPIKLVTCQTDGSPATSQRCANQILDQKPVAILGAADTGAPGAIPVWANANLPYLGGIGFTPVEQNYKNAVIFSAVSSADNATSGYYAGTTLKAKSAAVIYTSDTQGTASAENWIIPGLTKSGVSKVTKIAIPPTASDVSSAVATAVGANPDVIFVDAPAACPNILSSLKQLGNTAKIMGIDPCTSPAAIAGANGGAEGLYFATAVLDPGAGTAETKLYLAAMQKYAPASTALDSIASVGFQTVINVQAALAKSTPADLTTDKIMAAFKTGSDHPNFLGHPYTCDGTALPGFTAICNTYEQVRQVKNGKAVAVGNGDFINAFGK
ncbi:MAG: ABC transporter substrate-binding protein [Actinomycetota bacterium]|nr:ABC transporter substrate-binding protein [Actinomycetota bacterium]